MIVCRPWFKTIVFSSHAQNLLAELTEIEDYFEGTQSPLLSQALEHTIRWLCQCVMYLQLWKLQCITRLQRELKVVARQHGFAPGLDLELP